MLRGRTGSVFLLGRGLEAAGCFDPGIPAPTFFHALLFACPPTINQVGREAAAGLVLSRSVSSLLEVPRVISGEPGGISHLPWAVSWQQQGFTPSFRVWLQRL